MSPKDIARLARLARKAGISTMLELHIAAELLSRGEATLSSLANGLDTNLEAVAHAVSRMVTQGGAKCVTCREAVGFSIARLSPAATSLFKEIIAVPATPPLRNKNRSYRPIAQP
jgi:hypothetical protein